MVIPLLSVTHGQCDARPTVTFPAYTGTKFILLGDSWTSAKKYSKNRPPPPCLIFLFALGRTPSPPSGRACWMTHTQDPSIIIRIRSLQKLVTVFPRSESCRPNKIHFRIHSSLSHPVCTRSETPTRSSFFAQYTLLPQLWSRKRPARPARRSVVFITERSDNVTVRM